MGGATNFVDAPDDAGLYRSRRMNGMGEKGRVLGLEVLAMAGMGLAAALIGPFGTFADPLWLRLIRWELFALGGYVFFRPVLAGGEALAASSGLSRRLCIALACLLATLPTTLLVAWAQSGMHPARMTVGDLADLYPDVLVIGIIATIILLLLRRDRAVARSGVAPDFEAPPLPMAEPIAIEPVATEPDREALADAPAPFLARLPPHLGPDLLAVENEDHYVRAHTALGSTLILMRMRDAVAELASVEGHRVHRGWWVARAAVAQVVRRDRAMALRLVNGLEVPVARNEVPAVRAAGWL